MTSIALNPIQDLLAQVRSANDVRECIASQYGNIDLANLTECYIYGAGQDALLFIDNCHKSNIKILGVFDDDSKKIGQKFSQYTVQSTKSVSSLISKNSPAIITTHRVAGAANRLIEIGVKSFVPAWVLQILSPEQFTPHMYYRDWAEDLALNKDKYVALWNLFKDDESRRIYKAIIQFKLRFDPLVLLKNVSTTDEYFPNGIIKLTDEEVFVDGGAWTGDSVRVFKQKVNDKFKRVYAFEPSSVPLPTLIQNYANDTRVRVVNKGMHSETTVFRFEDLGSTASRFSAAGSIELPVTTIDEVVGSDPVSFIKLNIEGAEASALMGAQSTIRKHKPKMAICVYHNPRDIWELPEVLNKITDGYDYYLRHHDAGIIQLVVYAVPRQ